MRTTTIAETLREGLAEEMRKDGDVLLIGENIGLFGGSFQVTKGLIDEFGSERVRETPVSEAAIIGAAVGAALIGLRPVAEIMYMDFIACCMDQIVNQAAKIRFLSGGKLKVPLVIRTALGANTHGAHHAQCLEAWFMHTPGLKVVFPCTPYEAKGLLKSAIRDENPVIFLEHKLLYGRKKSYFPAGDNFERMRSIFDIPKEEYLIPLGKADIKRKGKDITIVATGIMVHKALFAAERLSREGIQAEIIDLRCLVPLDRETVVNSVRKTEKAVVVSEDHFTGGVASEISAIIYEEAFDYLDAPVERVATLDIPIPFSPAAEDYTIPNEERIYTAVKKFFERD
ncbi:MAG: alpha-ketoacid dehydrogenase subunit beta [Candidatus Aerophobus sp.]|nr:MAG: alpha-ketoacid dehydrogenase subunit beta [Candidatus Aerophobus sp.]